MTENMNIKEFNEIVKESKSFSEVSKKMYGNNFYGNRQTIKKRIIEYSIDISHFDFKSNGSDFKNRFNKIPLSEILIVGSTYDTKNLKSRLFNEGLKERKCELCGQDENWYGKHMSLILDHINGINSDHRLENLRIVCPNCNATLSTHGGKNIINKPKVVRVKTKKEINRMNISESQRRVKRPPYEQLQNEIKELGFTGTGKKYGVSDNAIRKWIKFYEKHTLS